MKELKPCPVCRKPGNCRSMSSVSCYDGDCTMSRVDVSVVDWNFLSGAFGRGQRERILLPCWRAIALILMVLEAWRLFT